MRLEVIGIIEGQQAVIYRRNLGLIVLASAKLTYIIGRSVYVTSQFKETILTMPNIQT